MTTLVEAFGVDIRVSEHATPEAALAHANSPENLARAQAYLDAVQTECERGLSPDDLAIFRHWWSGSSCQGDFWDRVGTGPAYGAIMQAISMGCG